jgi:ATP-dependent 26S proteasome regulatory subunit
MDSRTTAGQKTAERIARLIRARYPVIAVQSHEENRVTDAIKDVAKSQGKELYAWTISRGVEALVKRDDDGAQVAEFDGSALTDPVDALSWILEQDQDDAGLYLMKDLHPYLSGERADPVVVRALRDAAAELITRNQNVILLSPRVDVPADAEKDVAVVDFPLPDADELAEQVDTFIARLPETDRNGNPVEVRVNGRRMDIVRALQGLTAMEADAVLSQAVIALGHLDTDAIDYILEAKAEVIRQSGALEYWPEKASYADVGGLDLLKSWCKQSESAFTDEAREFGVEPDKGILLVGVPGCGKSLTAKAVAGGKRPLLRLDVGALFGSLVGQSEQQTRNALKVAEAVAPAVMWLDEIEKGLGSGGGELDGGTSQRVLGTLLTWMEESEAEVFVVATANDISSLRPELVRRFSETFFVDLPQLAEREEILAIHLAKRDRDPSDYDMNAIAGATEEFTGAELEKVVQGAIKRAFSDGSRKVTTDDLLEVAAETVPLATTMREGIDRMREWAKRARPASSRQASGNAGAEVESAPRAIEL